MQNSSRNSPWKPAGLREDVKTKTHSTAHTHCRQPFRQNTPTHAPCMNSFNPYSTQTYSKPFRMSHNGDSSTPPPCVCGWYYMRGEEGEGKMKSMRRCWEERRMNPRANEHHNTMSFSESLWIIYTRITEPKYTVDGMGEKRWEKWHDYLLTRLHPHPSRLDLMIPEAGEEWASEGGGWRCRWGRENLRCVCAVIVSEGEIIVSCTV